MNRATPGAIAVATCCVLISTSAFPMGRKAPVPPRGAQPVSDMKDVRPSAGGLVPSHTGAAATAIPTGPQPKIVFDGKEHNFGEVLGLDKIEHVFKFRNEGKADLKIDKVNTTCGCTAALLSANTIPPGGKGEITATFTVGNRQGPQTKHIYVLSNDPAEPKASLTLKGTITPPVSVEPSSVRIQDRDMATPRTVKITQTTDETLTLGEITQRLKLVTATLKEEEPLNGRKCYTLVVASKPDTAPGRYFENISIKTNLAKKPTIDIPVSIVLTGDIQATPGRVNLGSLKTGQEISRTITVSNVKGQAFGISSAEIDNKDFSISPGSSSKAAVSHTFTLTGKAPATPGVVRGKLLFHTDFEKQKQVEVTMYGYIPREMAPPRTGGGKAGAPLPHGHTD